MAATVNPSSRSDTSANGIQAASHARIDESSIPPYWSHRRYESYCSIEHTKPPPIILEDNTAENNSPVWARSVSINDYVLVTGTLPNVGNFIVWNCRIDTLNVSHVHLLIAKNRVGISPSGCHCHNCIPLMLLNRKLIEALVRVDV